MQSKKGRIVFIFKWVWIWRHRCSVDAFFLCVFYFWIVFSPGPSTSRDTVMSQQSVQRMIPPVNTLVFAICLLQLRRLPGSGSGKHSLPSPFLLVRHAGMLVCLLELVKLTMLTIFFTCCMIKPTAHPHCCLLNIQEQNNDFIVVKLILAV